MKLKQFIASAAPAFLAIAILLGLAYVVQHTYSNHLLADSNPLSSITSISTATYTSANNGITDNISGPDMQQYADGTPGLPLYPGAEMLSEDCIRECDSACVTYYTITDEVAKVEAFYKENLPKSGWLAIGEDGPAEGLIYQNYLFMWENTSSDGPGRLYLIIGLRPESGGTDTITEIGVWPDANNVPLHPKAKQIEVTWNKDPGDGILERVTTYTMGLSKEKALDYYKHAMAEEGWCLDYNLDSGLIYSFDHAAGKIGGGAIQIEVIPIDNYSVKVLIEARGTEVSSDDEEEKQRFETLP